MITTACSITYCNRACWEFNKKKSHSEYVIISAFTLQQCSQEPASILRLYVYCLSCSYLVCWGSKTLLNFQSWN